MKNILKSLLVVVAVAAVAGGATWSYFTSSATITGSAFTAGTLDLRVDSDPSGTNQIWEKSFAAPADFAANLFPGANGEQILDIKNMGSIDGVNATIQLNVAPGTWSALGDNLVFTISYKGEAGESFTQITTGTLAQFQGNTYTLGDLAHDKVGNVKINWSVPTSARDNVQGKSVTINTVFGLEQVK